MPLLSLIIPTRERCDTLRVTLKTVLGQDSAETEVLVSDNVSQDDTRQVVASFHDPRLRYIATPRRLSMCDNFEFACEHSKGRYVMFIGDDDALMPGALRKLEAEIRKDKSEIYFWPTHSYRPPSDGIPAQVVGIGVRNRPYDVDIKAMARFAVKWGGWRYYMLPHPYHGCAARRLLELIRERTGRIFHSMAPDMFLCAALPAVCDRARNLGEPLSAYVFSAKSNGAQSSSLSSGRSWAAFDRFMGEYGDYKLHPTLSRELAIDWDNLVINDAILHAMELFPEFYGSVKFNYSAMWAYGLRRFGSGQSVSSILSRRNTIRRFHKFSAVEFLGYYAMHRLLEFRFQRKCARTAAGWETVTPQSVEDFIKFVERLKSGSDDGFNTEPRIADT